MAFRAVAWSWPLWKCITPSFAFKDALSLADESKAQLAERLIEYFATHIDPDLERVHLDTVKSRKERLRAGKVNPVKGKDALAQARRIIETSQVLWAHSLLLIII